MINNIQTLLMVTILISIQVAALYSIKETRKRLKVTEKHEKMVEEVRSEVLKELEKGLFVNVNGKTYQKKYSLDENEEE